MTAFKPEQHHLTIRGRPFHFVSCDGRATNHLRAELGYPAMWYLLVGERRCPVLPCDSNRSLPELHAALRDWAEDNALGPVESAPSPSSPLVRGNRHRGGRRRLN